MPVLKKKITSDFTVIHNTFVRDKKMNINARGLLLTMLSMKDDWHFSIKSFAAVLTCVAWNYLAKKYALRNGLHSVSKGLCDSYFIRVCGCCGTFQNP